jgi:membrane protein DedA with SNARE-associated domain
VEGADPLIDAFMSFMSGLSSNPWMTGVLIILATFVLEDAATIAAGVLAVSGVISPPVALVSLYLGIIAGDAGLYGIGRVAHASGFAHKFVNGRTIAQGRRWLRRRLVPALVGARFTPGMRAPTFLASGFFRVSFWRFFAVITSVAAVWTTGIFCLIYFFGPLVAESIGHDSWVIGIAVIAVLFGGQFWFRRRARKRRAEAETP